MQGRGKVEAKLRLEATNVRLEAARATGQTWISICEQGRRGSLNFVGITHHIG